MQLSEVKRAALEVGFDACGVAVAAALADDEYPLRRWLDSGRHGGLDYMQAHVDKRMDPRQLVPGARSVVCCVSAYPPPAERGGVAAYARHRDYHAEVKQMLHALRQRLGIEGKVCCDTVPISDKRWAARAGLGTVGRHTLLITPRWGSWVNLGEIVTTEPCDAYDEPLGTNPCRDCGLCVEACPNGALAATGLPMLDAARCTARYTTHHPQPLPPGLSAEGYTLGCDICQMACPHNRIIN